MAPQSELRCTCLSSEIHCLHRSRSEYAPIKTVAPQFPKFRTNDILCLIDVAANVIFRCATKWKTFLAPVRGRSGSIDIHTMTISR